jgi:hypothetical protein
VTFAPSALADGWSRGTVRAGADALPTDNVFHFAVSRGQAVSTLIVDGRVSRADASLYLRRALAVGERSPFRVSVARAGSLRADDMAGRSLVVLDDAPADANLAPLLAAHVRRGGGLLVALGEASGARAWAPTAAALLPAAVGEVVDRTAQGGTRLATVDRSHPVFAPFGAPRSGDLSEARVLRYRTLDPTPDATVIARFADGAPALVEHAVGEGRVLVWASTLDNYWTDIAVQPVFLPLVHQLAKYAAGFRDVPPWLTVGQTLDLSAATAGAAPDGRSAADWVIESPSGRTEPLRGAPGAAPALTAAEQGFYTVRRADGRAPALAVAVNVDPAEADPARIDPAIVSRAVAADPRTAPTAPAASADATREDDERRQSAWWYLLAAALVLLAAETLLSNRLSLPRHARRPSTRDTAAGPDADRARTEGSWTRPTGTRRSA